MKIFSHTSLAVKNLMRFSKGTGEEFKTQGNEQCACVMLFNSVLYVTCITGVYFIIHGYIEIRIHKFWMKDICIDFCSGPCTVFLMLSVPWYVQDGSILTLVTDAGHNPPIDQFPHWLWYDIVSQSKVH